MGEVIILEDWKRQRELEAVELLQEELDELMDFLSIQREFYMFDTWGNPILIHSKGASE